MDEQLQHGDSTAARFALATWLWALREARSPLEVVAVVNEFLAQLDGDELEKLPARYRPRPIGDALEIDAWQSTLSAIRACASPQLHLLFLFLRAASARCGELKDGSSGAP